MAREVGQVDSHETTSVLGWFSPHEVLDSLEAVPAGISPVLKPFYQKSYVLQGWLTSRPTCCAVREHDCTSHYRDKRRKSFKNKSWPC